MKVSSPIGELPFTPRRLRYRNKAIELEGVMGAWPAQVQITFSDIPSLLKLIIVPAVIAVVAIAIVVVVVVALTHHS